MTRLGPTELSVLQAVRGAAGSTTNQIVVLVGERRQVVLRVLAVLAARGDVQAKPGPRRAQHWFPCGRGGTLGEVDE